MKKAIEEIISNIDHYKKAIEKEKNGENERPVIFHYEGIIKGLEMALKEIKKHGI